MATHPPSLVGLVDDTVSVVRPPSSTTVAWRAGEDGASATGPSPRKPTAGRLAETPTGRLARSKTAANLLNSVSAESPLQQEIRGLFSKLDTDGNGTLDITEIAQVCAHDTIGINFSPKELESAFARMDKAAQGEVTYEQFYDWWESVREEQHRENRIHVREMFEYVDTDGNGSLDKKELSKLTKSLKKRLKHMYPPFDLEADWKMMQKTNDEVTFQAFEAWWKERMGILDCDIAVLPEYMVHRIQAMWTDGSNDAAHRSKQISVGDTAETVRRVQALPGGIELLRSPSQKVRTAVMRKALTRARWYRLGQYLRRVVRLSNELQFGEVGDIYGSKSVSAYTDKSVSRYIRDPESQFSVYWDAAQCVFLAFVSYTVPYRTGFSIDVQLGSLWFWIDLIVDVYFISDLVLNFRTAFWNKYGVREERLGKVAVHYLRGWFLLDVLSCLPIQYIVYLTDAASEGGAESSNFRAFKALRLLRLSKMLRIAKIVKILQKYNDNHDIGPYLMLISIFFLILFLGHLLSCFWYLTGSGEQSLPGGQVIEGWVARQKWNESVEISTRYVTSLYMTFNALDHGETDAEKLFAIMAELTVAFIYGALAGTMSSLMMSFGGGEAEVRVRTREMKRFLQSKGVPKQQTSKILAHYGRSLQTSLIPEEEMISTLPPNMREEMAEYFYLKCLMSIPIFRGLASVIMTRLCLACKSMVAITHQEIFCEGQQGTEMYMLLRGELEVVQNGARLGFLGEGSYFGELSIFSAACDVKSGDSSHEMRSRTITAVTECELGYMSKEALREVAEQYIELKARLARFSINRRRKKRAFPPPMALGAAAAHAKNSPRLTLRPLTPKPPPKSSSPPPSSGLSLSGLATELATLREEVASERARREADTSAILAAIAASGANAADKFAPHPADKFS